MTLGRCRVIPMSFRRFRCRRVFAYRIFRLLRGMVFITSRILECFVGLTMFVSEFLYRGGRQLGCDLGCIRLRLCEVARFVRRLVLLLRTRAFFVRLPFFSRRRRFDSLQRVVELLPGMRLAFLGGLKMLRCL